MNTPSACSNCNKSGLPILPVRYTVVPAVIKPTMPAGVSAARVKDVAIDTKQYQYALRTMRSGFMYLFFEKGVRGKNYWEAYSISPEGALIKQADTETAQPLADASCARLGHVPVRTSFVCIEQPEKCGTVWLAYSEHKWSTEAVKEYTANVSLRSRRMQAIQPAEWLKAPSQVHAVEATRAALEHVLEYSSRLTASALSATQPGVISKNDGSFSLSKLTQETSRYPVFMRNTGSASNTQSRTTVEAMHISGKRPDGKSHPPMLLALWDAVGTAHELNGYRNEIAGRFEQYCAERAIQIDGVNLIDNVKDAIQDIAGKKQAAAQQHMRKMSSGGWNEQTSAEARASAASLPEPKRGEQLARIKRFDQDALDGIPSYLAGNRERAMMMSEPQRSRELDKSHQEISRFKQSRETNAISNVDNARARAARDWPKYEARLDRPALTLFKKNMDELALKVTAITDSRTLELLKWLEAPLLIDTLEDCHPSSFPDGLEFEDKIGNAVFGIASSRSGVKKIDAWVADGKASNKANFVWRTIALNQKASIADVDALFEEAANYHARNVLASQIDLAALFSKVGKGLADTYKKAQSVANANATAQTGTTAFNHKINPVNTRGVDKVMVAFGDRIFRNFRFLQLADSAAEHIITHMLNVRALVEPADSLKLLKAIAKNAGVARGDILQQMRSMRSALDATPKMAQSAQADAMKHAWQEFKSSNSKAPSAIKDARLAVIVLLFESMNWVKMSSDCIVKDDTKSYALLLASTMSITSLLLDVVAAPSKEVLSAPSWTYQKLKLVGGVLSGSAAILIAVFDVVDMKKQGKAGETGLAYMYAAKAAIGGVGGGLTLFTAATYAAPLLERLTGRAAVELVVRKAGAWAAGIIAARILMMTIGAWVAAGTTAIQIAIYYFTPDELEKWCSYCVFGCLRETYSNAQTITSQRDALALALQAIS